MCSARQLKPDAVTLLFLRFRSKCNTYLGLKTQPADGQIARLTWIAQGDDRVCQGQVRLHLLRVIGLRGSIICITSFLFTLCQDVLDAMVAKRVTSICRLCFSRKAGVKTASFCRSKSR